MEKEEEEKKSLRLIKHNFQNVVVSTVRKSQVVKKESRSWELCSWSKILNV